MKSAPHEIRTALIACLAILMLARDAGYVQLRLPENRRLIPIEVFYPDERSGSIQFGFELGTGVRTYLSASAPYLLGVFLFLGLAESLLVAILSATGFALGRWLTIVGFVWSGGSRAWRHSAVPRSRGFHVGTAAAAAAAALWLSVLG